MVTFVAAGTTLMLDGKLHFLRCVLFFFSLLPSPPSLEVNKSSLSCHPSALWVVSVCSKCVSLSHVCMRVCARVWLCVHETAVSRVPGVALFYFCQSEGQGDWMSEWGSKRLSETHSWEKAGVPVLNFPFTWDKQAITHPFFLCHGRPVNLSIHY